VESTINERIAIVADLKSKTQEEFAKSIKLSKTGCSNLLLGKSQPSLNTIQTIVNKYNINANWLLTGKGTMYNEIENKVEGIVSDAGVGYVRTLKKTENSTSTMELLQQLKSENELLRDQVRAWQSGLITRNVIS